MGAITSILVLCLILALANRANRIATLQAADESRQFVEQLEKAKLAMSVITQDFRKHRKVPAGDPPFVGAVRGQNARTMVPQSQNPSNFGHRSVAGKATDWEYPVLVRRIVQTSARGIQNPEQRSKLLDQALQDNARAEWVPGGETHPGRNRLATCAAVDRGR